MTDLTYCIGDIHGMLEELEKAAAWIEEDAFDRDHQVVCLGDYVDRGPESPGVIAFLREKEDKGWKLVGGNHDQMMIDSVLLGRGHRMWHANGGYDTMESYNELAITHPQSALEMMEADAKFLQRLPTLIQDDHRIYVHAGLTDGSAPEEVCDMDRMWVRDEFYGSTHDWGKQVVFGHTPWKEPYVQPNMVGLDGGACFGREMWVGRFDGPSRTPVVERIQARKLLNRWG